MKWIKATDRLPVEPDTYFVRYFDSGEKVLCRFENIYNQRCLFHKRRSEIEWLDETLPVDSKAESILDSLGIFTTDKRNRLYQQILAAMDSYAADRDYWKQRCEAAESFLYEHEPISYSETARKKYETWQQLKNQKP